MPCCENCSSVNYFDGSMISKYMKDYNKEYNFSYCSEYNEVDYSNELWGNCVERSLNLIKIKNY